MVSDALPGPGAREPRCWTGSRQSAATSASRRIIGEILPENLAMQRVCEKLGFRTVFNDDDRLIYAMLELTDTEK